MSEIMGGVGEKRRWGGTRSKVRGVRCGEQTAKTSQLPLLGWFTDQTMSAPSSSIPAQSTCRARPKKSTQQSPTLPKGRHHLIEGMFIDGIIPTPSDADGLTKDSAFPCFLLTMNHSLFMNDSRVVRRQACYM